MIKRLHIKIAMVMVLMAVIAALAEVPAEAEGAAAAARAWRTIPPAAAFLCYMGLAFATRRFYRDNPQDNRVGLVNAFLAGFAGGFALGYAPGVIIMKGFSQGGEELVFLMAALGIIAGTLIAVNKRIKTAIKEKRIPYYGTSLMSAAALWLFVNTFMLNF